MSVAQARGIVKGLKWHHLGFCFFWAVTFVALMAPADEFAFASTGFSVGKQLSTIVAVVVAATLSVRRGSKAFSPESAYIAGIALSAGSLLYYLAFFLADFLTHHGLYPSFCAVLGCAVHRHWLLADGMACGLRRHRLARAWRLDAAQKPC